MDLGSSPMRTFWKITLPIITPGVVAAFLLSLALSIDDYIITSFVAGPTITFPRRVFDSARIALPPQVHVLATIIMLVAIAIILAGTLLGNRRGERRLSRSRGRIASLTHVTARRTPNSHRSRERPELDGRGGRARAAVTSCRSPRPRASSGATRATPTALARGARPGAARRAGCSCRSPGSRTSSTSLDDEHDVGLRQGRVRRAGRRVGADARPRRAPRAGDVRPGPVVGAAAGPQPARRPGDDPRRRRDHRRRWSACCSRSTATSPSCAGGPRTSTASTTCSTPTATPTPCRAPTSSCVALALTPETEGLIAADELALMEDHAWLVNVARGRHVVTDDLVAALRDGVIGGAGLDVTDPEPLPPGHPLWTLPNCIITPHVGNTPGHGDPAAVGADHHQRPPLRRRRGADRARRHRSRLLSRVASDVITHYEVLGVADDGIDGGDPQRLSADSPASTTPTTTPADSGTMAARQRGLSSAPPPRAPRRLRRRAGGAGRASRPLPPHRVSASQGTARARRGPRAGPLPMEVRRRRRRRRRRLRPRRGGPDQTERTAAPPDNVLEPGSCVAIEANDDAREVICAGTADDLVVDRGRAARRRECARSGCRPTATARAWATPASSAADR